KPVLQASIVVLGTGLSLRQVLEVGGGSLPVMLGTLAVALGGAWLLGRWLGVRGDTQTLIGVGTGICGASAIAATTAVLKPKQ
ncbi:putative sulfate exporter family transporter, partial [Amycolatopsis sp. SID8362]